LALDDLVELLLKSLPLNTPSELFLNELCLPAEEAKSDAWAEFLKEELLEDSLGVAVEARSLVRSPSESARAAAPPRGELSILLGVAALPLVELAADPDLLEP
jgi:hypothetical protein